ncbi:MAG: PqqD family protein [Candidatus Binatia bacterium]
MDPTAEHERPKARSQGLTVQELDSELMVYDETAARAHCLNATAAMVWRYCDGNTTVAAMAARLGADAGASVDDAIVLLALSDLGDRGLLERPVRGHVGGTVSRRQALVRLGATAGILLPMITSIVAPTSAAAQSGSSGTSSGSSGTSSSGSSGTSSSGSSGETSSGSSGTSG